MIDAGLRALGIDAGVRTTTGLHGGSISDVRLVTLTDDREVVVKLDAGASAGRDERSAGPTRLHEEADGLRRLAATKTVRLPEVVGVATVGGQAMLVMERLPAAGSGSTVDWTAFAHDLAAMHLTASESTFGYEFDLHLGDTPLDNRPLEDWGGFLVERRFGPMLDRLDAMHAVSTDERAVLGRLIDAIPTLVPAGIRPALIHGDLWSGNVVPLPGGGLAMIDPSVLRADPLFELGMMRLFGGFPEACERAYLSRMATHPDWVDARIEVRIQLGRLMHEWNHWLLFGRTYADATIRTALGLVDSR